MKERVEARGAWGTVSFMLERGEKCPVEDFLEQLTDREQTKVTALLLFAAEYGPPRNREKFKPVEGSIYEFKVDQIRLFCFRVDTGFVITNGYKKKKNRLDPAQIERAKRLREIYLKTSEPVPKLVKRGKIK